MANYACVIRTNYFRVKDEDAFRTLVARTYGTAKIELLEKNAPSGQKLFAIATAGAISGVTNAKDDDGESDASAYDEFLDLLQDCLPEDEACILCEVGHEELNYLVGCALIITRKEMESVSINHVAMLKAGQMLGNPDWNTCNQS